MKILVRLLPAAVLTSLAACGSSQLAGVVPLLSIDKSPVMFGPEPVLTPVTQKIHFSNIGRAPLIWDAGLQGEVDDVDGGMVTIDGGVFSLSYSPDGGISPLVASDGVDAVITFNSPVEGSFTTNFVITTNDKTNPSVTIPVSASATTAAKIVVKPACLNFGGVAEGQTSVKQLTISSEGTAPLLIGEMAISNPAFQVLGSTAGGTVPLMTSIPLNVMFQPQAMFPNTDNMFTGNLTFPTNDPSSRLETICLQGTMEQLPTAVISIQMPAGSGPDSNQFTPGTMVTLSDEMSSAPAPATLTNFHWDLANIPTGSEAKACPDADAGGTCLLDVDQPGEYDVELTVTDSQGLTGTTISKIIGATSQAIQVELTWDTAEGDLDLHFYPAIEVDGGIGTATGFDSPCDLFANATPMPDMTNPDCGYGTNVPTTSGIKLSGFGPDWITYDDPANENYQVSVVYYSAQGVSGLMPTATVRVYLFGTVRSVFTKQMTTVGEQWNPCWISWPSETVTPGLAP